MPRCKTNPTSKSIHGWEMMEHLSCEKRLAEAGLFSLKERRLWGKAIEAFQCLTGLQESWRALDKGLERQDKGELL